jgi:putative methanogenesis marker domain 9
MPVKNCPLIPTLQKVGMTREEYIALKQNFVRGTPLEGGKQTCFGSLSWCCKDTSPCMFRDLTIRQLSLPSREYMRLKRELAGKLMERLFDDRKRQEAG